MQYILPAILLAAAAFTTLLIIVDYRAGDLSNPFKD